MAKSILQEAATIIAETITTTEIQQNMNNIILTYEEALKYKSNELNNILSIFSLSMSEYTNNYLSNQQEIQVDINLIKEYQAKHIDISFNEIATIYKTLGIYSKEYRRYNKITNDKIKQLGSTLTLSEFIGPILKYKTNITSGFIEFDSNVSDADLENVTKYFYIIDDRTASNVASDLPPIDSLKDSNTRRTFPSNNGLFIGYNNFISYNDKTIYIGESSDSNIGPEESKINRRNNALNNIEIPDGIINIRGEVNIAKTLDINGDTTISGDVRINNKKLYISPATGNDNIFEVDTAGKMIADESLTIRGTGLTQIDKALSITKGGVDVAEGDILVSIGNLEMSSGSVLLSHGNLTLSNGKITLSQAVSNNSISDILLIDKGHVSITKGNITLTEGDVLLSKGNFTLEGNIVSSKGNVTLSEGDVLMSKGNLTLTDGNITIKNSKSLLIKNDSDSLVSGLTSTKLTVGFGDNSAMVVVGDTTLDPVLLASSSAFKICGAIVSKSTTTAAFSSGAKFDKDVFVGESKEIKLTAAGAISASSATLSETLTVNGATKLNSTLAVTDAATMNSTLKIVGDTTGAKATFTNGSSIGGCTFTDSIMTGTSTASKYADLAEYYTTDIMYSAGTILQINTDETKDVEGTIFTDHVNGALLGVVSTNPAHLMNASIQGIASAVALKGRVPVKISTDNLGHFVIKRGDVVVVYKHSKGLGLILQRSVYLAEKDNYNLIYVGTVIDPKIVNNTIEIKI